MPLYDFHCLDCGEKFEGAGSEDRARMPEAARALRLEQQISTFAVSSESTRESNLGGAKKKHAKVHRDYTMDMHNAEKNHHH